MLSHSSAIDKRRQIHRRQNSTPAIFEATQIRPPTTTTMARHLTHKRGMSYDQNARHPGRTSPGLKSVSIPETIQQHIQHPMQEAQQQSKAQPGIQFPLTPSTQTRFQVPSPIQISQHSHGPSAQEIRELEDHIKRVYGVNGNVYVSILPTPVSTPEKPTSLPMPDNVDLAPMPHSLGNMADLSLDPPMGDHPLFDSDSLEIPDSEGYESSYYSSDPLSPTRSPTCSPQQRSISTFLEQVRNPRLPFALSTSASFPPVSHPANDFDQFCSQPPSSPTRSKSFTEINVNGSVLDTGFSDSDIGQYMSEQDPATGKWSCMFEDCGKMFGRKENIRSHIQTHLGDRQFKCNFCEKCFVRSHDLKRHVLIHSDEKPYACKCGSRFARQDALTRHRQRGMCEGGIHNPSRGSARRGRPKKERAEMQKRMDKANRTRRAIASAASMASAASHSSPPASQDSSPTWIKQEFDQFCQNEYHSPEARPSVDDALVNDIYSQLATEAFNSHTPPMSATDSPSPLSISSPEYSSEPDTSFSQSFFDGPAKLDDIFTDFDPIKDPDWVDEMMKADPVF